MLRPAAHIAAVRNRIVHRYFGIDDSFLFLTVDQYLKSLLPRLEALAHGQGLAPWTGSGGWVSRTQCRRPNTPPSRPRLTITPTSPVSTRSTQPNRDAHR